MKHKNLLLIAAAGVLSTMVAGCMNTPNPVPAQDPIPLKVVRPAGMNIPMRWVDELGSSTDHSKEITSLNMFAPYKVDMPAGFSAVGTGLNSIICVSPEGASIKYFVKENVPGGTLDFWRKLISRSLMEKHNYRILQDKGFRTTENIPAWTITAARMYNNEEYKYALTAVSFDGNLYLSEMYGKSLVFDAAAPAYQQSVASMDLGFWRVRHLYECTNPYLAYDPVVVTPKAGRGLINTSWTPIQLGFMPWAQLWESTSNVYGLDLDLLVNEQKCVAGISFGLFNAVKESYGLHVGALMGATERNCGLSIGLLYNLVRDNDGVSIGLINRAEEGSQGIQIGLLNFNSSPDYLSWFPIINLPLFSCFR